MRFREMKEDNKIMINFVKTTKEDVIVLREYNVFGLDGKEQRLPLLHYPLLEETGIVEHCFTTRLGGVSEDIFSTLNFSFTRGDNLDSVMENYRRVGQVFGKTEADFICTDQTHTTNVLRVGKEEAGYGVTKPRPYTDVDGLITNEPGVILSTFYADCVPLYFVDPVHKAIGLSHSGWRGTVGRMGQKTLEAMKEAFGTKPEDVYAAIGPSICQDCYEVSEDVIDKFREAFEHKHWDDLFYQKVNRKYQLNLWKANEIILLEAGVQRENIAVTNVCTCCNSETLYSHRASKGQRGGLAAFMGLVEL